MPYLTVSDVVPGLFVAVGIDAIMGLSMAPRVYVNRPLDHIKQAAILGAMVIATGIFGNRINFYFQLTGTLLVSTYMWLKMRREIRPMLPPIDPVAARINGVIITSFG